MVRNMIYGQKEPFMKHPLRFIIAAALSLSLLSLAGCASSSASTSGSASAAAASASASGAPAKVTVGTLATEDILPVWVAEEEGLFAAENLTAEVMVFQSATELIAGVTSGTVDFAMTDPMVTASIYASGTDVQVQWVTLGADASQGRFGIMTADPTVTSLTDLTGVPVGVGSNTILEYVMDTLFARAGVSADQVMKEELQKLPVRYQAMASGQVKAAALPGSLLALGESAGCTVVADDTTGENLSQSVMISRGNPATAAAFARVWNAAVAKINAAGESYRALLVSKATLSDAIAATYPISTYPTASLPEQAMVDSVLTWMKAKGYLAQGITYNAANGTFAGR